MPIIENADEVPSNPKLTVLFALSDVFKDWLVFHESARYVRDRTVRMLLVLVEFSPCSDDDASSTSLTNLLPRQSSR